MAQKEKTEFKVPETLTLTLCINNCGNPVSSNTCHKCFNATTTISGPQPPPRTFSSSRRPDATRVAVQQDPNKQSTVNRCSGCRKKVGLTGFRCRCGDLFCSDHRYSDRHLCSYDYKTAGREAIARDNPVVKAAKIIKL